MRTKWTTKGNRDASSSCSCDRGLRRYLAEYLYGILMALIHTCHYAYVTSCLGEKKKYHCGGDSWRGGLFTKQLKKWVKAVLLLGCYGCIFHGTGNSAQLCQNFGISEGGGWGRVWTPPSPSVRHCPCMIYSTFPVNDIRVYYNSFIKHDKVNWPLWLRTTPKGHKWRFTLLTTPLLGGERSGWRSGRIISPSHSRDRSCRT